MPSISQNNQTTQAETATESLEDLLQVLSPFVEGMAQAYELIKPITGKEINELKEPALHLLKSFEFQGAPPQSLWRSAQNFWVGSGVALAEGYAQEFYHNNPMALGYRVVTGEEVFQKSYLFEGGVQVYDNAYEVGRSLSNPIEGIVSDAKQTHHYLAKNHVTQKAYKTAYAIVWGGYILARPLLNAFAPILQAFDASDPHDLVNQKELINLSLVSFDYASRVLINQEALDFKSLTRFFYKEVYQVSQGTDVDQIIDQEGKELRWLAGAALMGISIFLGTKKTQEVVGKAKKAKTFYDQAWQAWREIKKQAPGLAAGVATATAQRLGQGEDMPEGLGEWSDFLAEVAQVTLAQNFGGTTHTKPGVQAKSPKTPSTPKPPPNPTNPAALVPSKPGGNLPAKRSTTNSPDGPETSLAVPAALADNLEGPDLDPKVEEPQKPENPSDKLALEDITHEMILAYLDEEAEIFGEASTEAEQAFRRARDRSIQADTELVGKRHARQLALMIELSRAYPKAEETSLMKLIDVGDRMPEIERMQRALSQDQTIPSAKTAAFVKLVDQATQDDGLSYYDYLSLSDEYIEIAAEFYPSDRLSKPEISFWASRYFPYIIFTPKFGMDHIEELSDKWPTNSHPIALLKPGETAVFDGDRYPNGLVDASSHDRQHSQQVYQWLVRVGDRNPLNFFKKDSEAKWTRYLTFKEKIARSRISFNRAIASRPVDASLIQEIFWLQLDHEMNDLFLSREDRLNYIDEFASALAQQPQDMSLGELKETGAIQKGEGTYFDKHPLQKVFYRFFEDEYFRPVFEQVGVRVEHITVGQLAAILQDFRNTIKKIDFPTSY